MEISVRRTDGLVIQYGHNLGERPDCRIVTLPSSEEGAFAVHVRNGQPVHYLTGRFVAAAASTRAPMP